MNTILIPTDFSKNSKNALLYALDLFRHTPCHFIISYINLDGTDYKERPIYNFGTNILVERAPKGIQEKLEDLKKLVYSTSSKGTQHLCSLICKEGFFVKAIQKLIHDKNVDLIIMGTKGATALKEFFTGSHAGDVITKVGCDVLVVPHKARYNGFTQLVFPVDFELPINDTLLKKMDNLVGSQPTQIHLLYVTKSDIPLFKEVEVLQRQWVKHISETLNKPVEFHRVISKKVEDGIQSYTDEISADLIVMISKEYGPFHKLFMDTTVEEVSFNTKIPLLSIQV